MKKLSLLVVVSMLTLSGCAASMRGKFDCPGTPGVQCRSISEVNRMVDEEHIPEQNNLDKQIRVGNRKTLQRSKEEVLTVWVAPFEDEEGIFHEPGRLTAVVSPAKWELSKV